ncbi:GMC oxidoreductase [Cucurbitaria berberidis CBS 394.84]|uniref:GMC oxidoreductase n=1 Tax=Cucurbitaria berberidis CBS 394.84 TaxID=1168544 RepID=A0A9P4GJE8_9PLEO|nr:GMC oxidoreductase [Cucurbitaria berberidis CBS 394.84]KAF1846496.1 GMC oxidoreductase [Cucurbitaria berberidis CBS 394.84]
MAKTFDFVIVGGGTAGCLLAHRLSHSPAKPSVLVLEAGSNPEGEYLRAPFHRYLPAALRPDLDHGYVSEPEAALDGRRIPYTRGKGLGGSSIMNFGVYLYGSGEDYNRWGELVGDESWRWDSVKESFRAIENYEFDGAAQYAHLADPSANNHGTSGVLKVGLPPLLEKGVVPQMEAVLAAGDKVCLDPNSGNPVGVSIFPSSYSNEGRSTSAIAHLLNPPENLEIWTNAKVQRLIWEGTRVVGVVTSDGREAAATKEVILCGGAIDTPKLLLLNGIGPKAELETLGIEVKQHLPGVGKHLQDHVLAFMSVEVDGSSNDRYTFESNENLVAEADKAWKQDQSGAFALQQSVLWGGFLKLTGLDNLPEYRDLPPDRKEFIARDAVPTYEFINNSLLWPPGTQLTPGNSYMTCIAFLMNPQSEGSVTLKSTDADDNPKIMLNYLTHPYDARIMREAIRSTWTKIIENPTLKNSVRKTLCGPASLSDDDVDAFMRANSGTVWHANGTVKMGKAGDEGACVDSAFKVFGVQGLRVADLSVCPLTTNNHSQATAYLVGQKAAEKLLVEYGLRNGDEGRSKL